MLKLILLSFALFITASCTVTRTYPLINGSVIVNDTILNTAVMDFKYLLVNFDAACKWCKIFRPFYQQARVQATAAQYGVRFAWMDLKTNPVSKAKYNITRHPTQMLFVRGYKHGPVTYYGVKNTKGLVAWLDSYMKAFKKAGF